MRGGVGVYTHGCLAQELQKRVLDPLELGFPVVVSIRCGCRNQTRVFCKSSACANHCAVSSALTFLLLLLLRVQRSEGHLQASVLTFSSKSFSPTLSIAGWGGDKVSCPTGAPNSSVPPASVSQTEMIGKHHQDPAGSLL